uniref:Transmembrane protein 71 n=1 Tax=Latimeria chalumnae TaxID=7897 RepID=H3AIH0_LATCH|nr:PREDICTED: transmembrane protein 71 [Latimeria chalumnae]XP_014352283.1 PREDICTED: transmembrane protein 71 [Latimeria chalumnae]XP_014352284.1 PREDICTED: transmembrane protein 71 [Latimeria chalumnae]XP_014352285.1 PREDICTED: transmembrane protein 71 [Latimeria chalumnae]|eukprot:XP_006009658.2 PREDICTED: transmembrane protein 71 [Latimeria chalumnae]
MHNRSPVFSAMVADSPTYKSKEDAPAQECSGDSPFQSCSFSFLSDDSSYKCHSMKQLICTPCVCRRSPRLLTNGYYVLTEDSYIISEDGNISLSPSQTNISYKENLVRVFRRRKRVRRALASLFDLTTSSNSWLNSSIFSSMEPPMAESSFIEEEGGGHKEVFGFSFISSNTEIASEDKPWATEKETAPIDPTTVLSASPSKLVFSQPVEGLHDRPPEPQLVTQTYLHEEPFNRTEDIVKTFYYQMMMLFFCLCIFAFASWFSGGLIGVLFTFMLIFLIFCKYKTSEMSFLESTVTTRPFVSL